MYRETGEIVAVKIIPLDEAEGGGLDERAGDYGGGRGLADDSENY